MARISRFCVTLIASLALSACQFFQSPAQGAANAVRELGQASHCGFQSPQLQLIRTVDRLPSLNGRLRASLVETLDAGDFVLLVALGQRPTPGYGASLQQTRVVNSDRLSLQLTAFEPEPGTVLAQVLTTPCLALSVPASGWRSLSVALDAEGFPQTLDHPDE